MNTPGLRVVIREDGIAMVELDRPPVNAFTAEMGDALIATFDSFTDRDDVRAVVLTGTGKVFCAGADIKERAGRDWEAGERWSHNRRWREVPLSILECKKPVIAAVNGAALGGGLVLITVCDIVLASTEASVGLNEINVGLLGGFSHASRLFGQSRARRMMYTGHRVNGEELHRLGISEACVAPDALMDAALAIAEDIAQKSPAAVKLAKMAITTIENMTLRDGYRFEQEMTMQLSQHPDSLEAMLAFLERRAGRFGK